MMDEARKPSAGKDSLGDEGVVHGHIHKYDNITLIHGHVHRTSLGASDVPADKSFLSKGMQGSEALQLGSGNQFGEKCFSDEIDNLDCQFFQFVNYHQGAKPIGGTRVDATKVDATKVGAGSKWGLSQSRPSMGSLYNDEALLLPNSKRRLSYGTSEENCYCPPKILEICCDGEHNSTPTPLSTTEPPDLIPRVTNRDEPRRYKKNRRHVSKSGIDSLANLSLNFSTANCDVSCEQVLEPQDLDLDDEDNEDENIFEKFCQECLNLGHEHKHEESSSPDNLEAGAIGQHCRHHHHHSYDHIHSSLPRNNSSTTLSSTQSANSEVELPVEREMYQCSLNPAPSLPPLAAKKYPHHVMNSQIDLQILDDLCDISSLYEVPFANHMNHHNHHNHSSDSESNQGINLLESSIKGQPSASGSNVRNNHHHHRIQLQTCMTDCQAADFSQTSSGSTLNVPDTSSVWNNNNYSFERSTITKTESPESTDMCYQTVAPKLEEYGSSSQEPTVEFNWSFKKDQNAIQCKWDQCPETFSSLIDLQKHMLRDHVADKDASCYWIPCTFKGEDTCSLINHINSDHGINFGLNIASTNSCAKSMIVEQDWLPHTVQPPPAAQIDSSTTKFQCKWGDCTAVLDSAASLTEHLEGHLDRGKSEYQCLWCDCNRKFAQRQKLVRHLKVHSGYKPHKCQVCGKCFSNEDTLTQHIRIHSGEKPFECHICGKRFAVSSSLKIHIRTHTGEKPLECKVCGKRFSESSNLSKHMKCHRKKYNCTHCKRGFDTIDKLQAHEARCSKKSK